MNQSCSVFFVLFAFSLFTLPNEEHVTQSVRRFLIRCLTNKTGRAVKSHSHNQNNVTQISTAHFSHVMHSEFSTSILLVCAGLWAYLILGNSTVHSKILQLLVRNIGKEIYSHSRSHKKKREQKINYSKLTKKRTTKTNNAKKNVLS